MNLSFRKGRTEDLTALKTLAVSSWSRFQLDLTTDNWLRLYNTLTSDEVFAELLEKSDAIVCEAEGEIAGMAFLMPSGNPTEIYEKGWSYIRFVSVDPNCRGKGIGRKLTTLCIDAAKANGEKVIALHTSEFMHEARHIYESLGFEVLKEIDQRLGKRYWLYTLHL